MSSEEERRNYVAGFLFHKGRVLLVRKSHPKWQAGMMNGVGGEIEPGESATDAMAREFDEEAGLRSTHWQFFASEYGPGYAVHFFRLFLPDEPAEGFEPYKPPKENDKGEELEWRDPTGVKYPVIGNLHWLLPLACDPRPLTCVVQTEGDIRKLVTW